ncbi:MAG: aminopeptidase P family protein [Dysgonamonadaceae bacterium]|jgi:Xaa-Pro aminopeptidase|nr:aminopeptidase P family protein [Dysgonamonadaceae bacterium]
MGNLGRTVRQAERKELAALRQAMREAGIQACIIPSTDPHCGEYTPEHWKTRQWLSGFTGSAGTVVVTLEKAGLWTDSRYFLQAGEQLQDSGIDLFKSGLPETLDPEAWLTGELSSGDTVGIEGAVFAASEARHLVDFFTKHNIKVNAGFAPYDALWSNRPEIPLHPAFILSESFSGESASSKIARLLKELQAKNCQATVLASLDSIAWLFNLRGNDISYNPVAVAFAFVSEQETVLFIDSRKLTGETSEYLRGEGVVLAEYEKIYSYLQGVAEQVRHDVNCYNILITPDKINYRLYQSMPQSVTIIEERVHPADQLKAIKNETEIAGIRNAMKRDGVALVKFLYWLQTQIKDNQTITELDVSAKLRQFRSEQDYFVSESFETISGYGAHGAIVHYAATPESNVTLLPEGLLLLDSGAQYFDGTTDITRTIALGPVTDEMRKDYTLVLKGHIHLALAQFPKGTIGMQLDVLARQFLWQYGENYLHGTGHGVGHFLNVHEGPQNIRMNYNPAPLCPGMLTSNEPGVYKTGRYGIRIENLILTVPAQTTEFGDYYAFETLTLCPLDRRLLDLSLMNELEIRWYMDYQNKVYEALSPCLSTEEKQWLKAQL